MEAVYGNVPHYWASDKIVIKDFLSKCMQKFPKPETVCTKNYFETISWLMQADLVKEQVACLVHTCSIDKLTCDNEPHSVDMKILKSKPYLFNKVEPDPNSILETQKELVKRKSEGKRVQNLKYRGDIWNTQEKSSRVNLRPGEELLISVRIYQPFMHRKGGRNNPQPRCNKEVHVLSQQNLCILRDVIQCSSDGILAKECSENPEEAQSLRAKDVYKSGFFFIDDTFYNDLRCSKNIDYSAVIRKWASERDIGQFHTKRMEETQFIDLSLHLGCPYVYQHQGSCEHLIVFSDIRLLSATDSLSIRDYPWVQSHKMCKTRYCMVCGNFAAKWITCNNERIPHDPAYFCDTCFKSYNYIDGKKIGNFKAYPYTDINTMVSKNCRIDKEK